jgi:hypothetical protein
MAIPAPIPFPQGHNYIGDEEVEDEGDHRWDEEGLTELEVISRAERRDNAIL